MNILFHLLPKESVAYISVDSTLRQAMEKMEYHRYTAVPIINESGEYIGVLREGDILWYIKNLESYDLTKAEKIHVKSIPRINDHKSTTINANIDDLFDLSIEQNFVPVVDDGNRFIGIVTRKSIITYLLKEKLKGDKQ